jgi:hypothetical protein
MELHTIGIDLGKTVFHLAGLNLRGEVVVRKKFSRTQAHAKEKWRNKAGCYFCSRSSTRC